MSLAAILSMTLTRSMPFRLPKYLELACLLTSTKGLSEQNGAQKTHRKRQELRLIGRSDFNVGAVVTSPQLDESIYLVNCFAAGIPEIGLTQAADMKIDLTTNTPVT